MLQHCLVWLVGKQLLLKMSCVVVNARCSALHKTGAYTLSFFKIRGRTMQPHPVALDSPITMIKGWILQITRHSNNSSACHDQTVCVWPLHSIHCQPACPSASSRLSSLIQPEMFLMLALKLKMMKLLASPGIRRPILKANNLH